MNSPSNELVSFVRNLTEEERTAFLLANSSEGFDYTTLPAKTVGVAAAELIPPAKDADGPRNFLIYNNGANSIWITFGSATPIGDNPTPAYNGYGIRITGGNYYESPHSTFTAVNAIAVGGNTKITVVLITPRKAKRPVDCRAVCPA